MALKLGISVSRLYREKEGFKQKKKSLPFNEFSYK